MISSAISFLSNPRVNTSPLSRRLQFLESKGVTSAEIVEAIKRHYTINSQEYKTVNDGVNAVTKSLLFCFWYISPLFYSLLLFSFLYVFFLFFMLNSFLSFFVCLLYIVIVGPPQLSYFFLFLFCLFCYMPSFLISL